MICLRSVPAAAANQFRSEHPLGAEQRARLFGQLGRPLQIGDHHRIAAVDNFGEGRRDRQTDEVRRRRLAVHHRRYPNAGIEGADHCDLRQIGNAGERQPVKAALGRSAEHHPALGLRPAEEAERHRQIFDGQTGFFGEALRRQIIDVAAGRCCIDLDQPLLDASPQIGVDQAQRDAKLGGKPPLRLPAIALHRIEQIEQDALVLGPIILGSLKHEDPLAHPQSLPCSCCERQGPRSQRERCCKSLKCRY